ncbi:MAG: acyl-CoA thioesterase [Elusimicrobia bacterium]|jgi:acyl-CoA thioester hydrolase|nr:acyl-CoA thioesterase [Elusimicrobiota bacterium]
MKKTFTAKATDNPLPKRRQSEKVKLTVPFHDVDSLGVVWHGHYYKYFEIARTAFFKRRGFDISEMESSGYVWPIIESHCRYGAPLRYGMSFEVTATLCEVEHRVKFLYSITDRMTRSCLTTGYTIQATVHRRTGTLRLTTPQVLLRRLQ